MDVLARIMFGGSLQASSSPGPTDDYWYRPYGDVSSAGIPVTTDGALRVSAVFAAVRLLADTLAALPLLLYRRLPNNGGKERATDHPLYDVLHTQPNAWQDSFQWRRMMMRHILLRGAGYNFITPGPRGAVDQLVPIHPDRVVKTEQLPSGRLLFHIRDRAGARTTPYTQDEVLRLPGVSEDGIECKSVLTYARDSVGLALATESYATRLFSQSAMHGGVIKMPQGVTMNDEASDRMAKSFQAATSGLNRAHRPVVLEMGAEWVANTMTAEDSQFLLSRKFSVTDIARWFGVPPHMIGDLERSTNNNIEQQSLEFVTYDLTPWLVLWEQAIGCNLILAPQTYFAEFNVEALLRGDSAARSEFFAKMFGVGAYSPNDILAIDNRNKVAGGDQRFVPANMRPLDAPWNPADPGATDFPPPAPRAARSVQTSALSALVDVEPAARLIAVAAAGRVLRKEVESVRKLAVRHAADGDVFAAAVADFYARHAALVAETLALPAGRAAEYCASQAAQIVGGDWIVAVETWLTDHYAAGLAALALETEAA